MPYPNNVGLIISASSQITPDMTDERKKELKQEYSKRENNRRIVSGMFNRNCITPIVIADPTRDILEKSVDNLAKMAIENSYSYIYINCHGNESGLSLVLDGAHTILLSYSTLRTMFDKIPGKKVLMIESCHSGACIDDTSDTGKKKRRSALQKLNQSLLTAFKPAKTNGMLKSGEFRASDYFVISACHPNEYAWGDDNGNYFTQLWCEGAGWDYKKSMRTSRLADTNSDGFVSLTELSDYTKKQHYKNDDYESDQDDMIYPEGSTAPIFGDVPIIDSTGEAGGRNQAILDYYNAHGGRDGEFGDPLNYEITNSGIIYQNFVGGVIVQYPDGKVVGHTKLQYILEHIKQIGKIGDGRNDNSLEMYIVVRMNQDGSDIEDYKRWPEYSSKKHGGTEFDIVYTGKSVSAGHPKGSNVYYDSLTIHGNSHIYLVVEVWDYDKYNPNDHIRDYVFDLNINNGWGFDMDIPLKFNAKNKSASIVSYKGVYNPDDKIILDMSVKSLGPFVVEDNPLTKYYLAHGGENGTYGKPVSDVHTVNGAKYQNFEGGVIVQYKNGTVTGHTKLRYILEHIKQTGKIDDGVGDNTLELYIVVRMSQDGYDIEDYKRWPEYSSKKHGGKEFDIVYTGKAVTAEHPKDANVFYDSLILRGESHVILTVEVWDYDKTNENDRITTYEFDLNIDNGWGYDMDIPQKFISKTKGNDTVSYKEIIQKTEKIKLNMSVKDIN